MERHGRNGCLQAGTREKWSILPDGTCMLTKVFAMTVSDSCIAVRFKARWVSMTYRYPQSCFLPFPQTSTSTKPSNPLDKCNKRRARICTAVG